MLSHVARREAIAGSAKARREAHAARRARVAQLWPLLSIRDIAMELDVGVTTIINDAYQLGLGTRPIAKEP